LGGSIEKTTRETKEKIVELYVKEKLSIGGVARSLGTGQGLVQRVLEEAGVPMRTKAEGYKLFLERGGYVTRRETDEHYQSARKANSL
jgi:transposase-like protein